MSKVSKLGEAHFFLNRMRETLPPIEFQYYLSAFLSASRSVLQYVEKEAEATSQAAATWYRTTIAGSLVLQFFREERNRNVHERPVRANHELISTTDESIEVTLPDGTTERRKFTGDPSGEVPDGYRLRMTLSMVFYFDDWKPQSVLELCPWYLEQVEELLRTGFAAGHISDS